MIQRIFDGTVGTNYFDASGEDSTDIAVFRDIRGGDTAIGGAGADRFASYGGADLFGGGGNDQFHIVFGPARAAAGYDTINGGTGTDGLYITVSSGQLTNAFRGELGRLKEYLDHDASTGAEFISNPLHVDMKNVETAWIRLDGVLTPLSALQIAPTVTQLIANGGFESGNLDHWTNSSFSFGTPAENNFFVTSDAQTPTNHNLTPDAAGGDYYAVSDSLSAGVQIISQEFTVPVGTNKLKLSFDLFERNGASATSGNGLAGQWGSQHFRVDVLDMSTANSLKDTDPAHIAASVIAAGTVAPTSWQHYDMDLSAALVAGHTYALRFAGADTVSYLNLGVDNVSLTATDYHLV